MRISAKKIEFEKNRIVRCCKSCKGIGCSSCFGYCALVDHMAEAEIPVDYWYRNIEGFYGSPEFKKKIEKYIENIDDNYRDGNLVFLIGHHGTGKTMMACNILKKAKLKGFTIFYSTLTEAVSQLTSSNAKNFNMLMSQTDFLVLDEVDPRFFPSRGSRELYGYNFERIIRMRAPNNLPTIICTNMDDLSNIFEDELEEAFSSLRSQYGIFINSSGLDARKTREKKC